MSEFTQQNRLFQLTTPFGPDVLLFGSMTGVERLSQPYELTVTAFSEDGNLDADQILGKPAAVKIPMEQSAPRYFHGLVADFSWAEYGERLHMYRLKLRPWLAFLELSADCRAFQGKTIPDIVQEVCRQSKVTADMRLALQGTYDPLEYCVQFRETDCNFVSRLLEQAGIFYYFEHSENKHTLVLCDDTACLNAAPGCEQVVYRMAARTNTNRPTHEACLSSWLVEKALRPGAYATRQFEFKTPSSLLEGTDSIMRPHGPARFEVFDFPACAATPTVDAVEKVARLRVQELQTGQTLARASGDAVGLATGRVFKLGSHPRDDFNVGWVVTSCFFEMRNNSYFGGGASSEATFSTSIEAVPVNKPYHPARVTPKPLVHGLQCATVVGPKGSEICTDEFGRIKVQFHWDRQGKLDENSSCWIRVAQNWAGKGWGALTIPRVGQEVVVAFLDGDADRPVIVGSLYNGSHKPPYSLPANATQSGVRSRSTASGASGNEIRFEDKRGAEQLVILAEKDHQVVVKNDESVSVKRNQTTNAGESIVVKAGTSITFSAGLATLTLDATGIVQIDGLLVTINGKTAVNISAAAGLIKGPKIIPL